jgi:VanZ family protein
MNPTVRKWMKLVAWFSFAAIAAVTILPITLRPTFSSSSANIERFFVMTIVGGLFVLAYPRRFWAILFALPCAVALLEPLQFLVASRHPSIHDVLVKDAGAATGVIAVSLLGLIWRACTSPKQRR